MKIQGAAERSVRGAGAVDGGWQVRKSASQIWLDNGTVGNVQRTSRRHRAQMVQNQRAGINDG